MFKLIASVFVYGSILLAFLLGFGLPKSAHSQSMPAVTTGVVAAVSRTAVQQPSRVILVDGIPAVEMDGQRQLLVTAIGAPLLWRTSGHALTDILSRLTAISCDEDEIAWRVDGRTVLCTEQSRHGLTEAQAAIGQLQHIRILAARHPRMTDPIAAALAPRAIGLVDTILYARRHHGRAPHAARAKRSHRHH